jgi:SAM-dependent methyltransferase
MTQPAVTPPGEAIPAPTGPPGLTVPAGLTKLAGPAGTPDRVAANRSWWDERVPLHLASDYYDVDGFRRHPDVLRDFETAEVGDVSGRSLLHLQCHFGQDTLSWAHRGALVSGLDFSAPAIEAARALAAELDLPARFVVADVYDAADAFAGETFDIVYTGFGALLWLPDLDRWARTVAELLTPGGFLYLAEFHPVANVLDDADGGTFALDYFDDGPQVWDEIGTYADVDAQTRANVSVEYHHPLGTVLSAIAAAGLRLEFVRERDVTLVARFDSLARGADGYYRRPAGAPRVPLIYTVRAAKPPSAPAPAPTG